MEFTLRGLKRSRKEMKRLCSEAIRGGNESGEGAWLTDNYLLLEGALLSCEKFIKKHRGENFSALFSLCRTFFLNGAEYDEKSIVSLFKERQISLSDAEALGASLTGAAVMEAIKTGSFEKAVKALFSLRNTDIPSLLPLICPAERLLCSDEGYRLSDEETKTHYREAVIRLSKKTGRSETETVKNALEKGEHIGFYLYICEKRRGGAAFLACEWIISLFISLALSYPAFTRLNGFLGSAWGALLFSLILLLPVFSALKPVFDFILQKIYKPFFLPSLNGENVDISLPETLITVSSLLPPAEKAADFAEHMRELKASHTGSPARVLALFDLKNADSPVLPSDSSDIDAMKREIERLNEISSGGFIMAVRPRVFSPTENEYTGFERKRGAVETLVRLIKEGSGGFDVFFGDTKNIGSVKYILALDADTSLPFEELKKLLCAAHHPLNRAVLNESENKVVSGYGCFSPRAEVSVFSASSSLFSRIMTSGGISAYSPRVSGGYMDMFSSSLFSGKGLIDVDVYFSLLAGEFENGRVLSHDILEGSLLKTAFVSHCAVTENFPSSPSSYYKRAERWIRGDVQNLVYLFRPLKKGVGGKRLPKLSKYQLADNFRRSISPVICLISIFLSLFLPSPFSLIFFFAGVLGRISPALFSAAHIFISDGAVGFTRIYFSACISGGLKSVFRAAVELGLLPFEAFISADAILRALYRTLFSRKKTLAWTTAADGEKKGNIRVFCQVVFPLLFAFFLLSGGAAQISLSLIILFFFSFSLSDGIKREEREKQSVSEKDYDSLLEYISAMWRFFSENAGEEDNFLPPDNIQETPVKKTAHRISPTNIGLYLVCVLAAADMSLISPKELYERLSKSLSSVFSLKRYNGLLYNWYNTLTLEPLYPPFVSSVDDGNYLVCLTALKEGLKEYVPLGLDFNKLIEKIENEIKNARIETLYDKKRKLFSIGMDVRSGKFSDSCYDYYMSEARMTSFYSCAKRLIPASHWGELSRPFLKNRNRTAAASYSGTMFEYFMPALFMPVYKNTYQFEGLKSAFYEQKNRVKNKNRPWGISESGFYAFDDSLSYCYKAHGLKTLAIKRRPDDESVFSPYSSFLAFPIGFKDAMKNLRRFSSLGAYGACGFYEAADFSKRAMKEDYMIVRSYMAHHIGMSMIAAVNAVRDDIFVKRFTGDPDINSALSLLMEKIPADAPVSREKIRPQNKKRMPNVRNEKSAEKSETDTPVFSNGEVSLICAPGCKNYFLFGERTVFKFSRHAPGLITAVKTAEALYETGNGEAPAFGSCVLGKTQAGGLVIESGKAVISNYSSLFAPVKLKNNSKKQKSAELMYYFEPSLERLFYESEHPAFSDMGIRIEYDKNICALVIRRIERGKSVAYLAVGFSDHTPFSFECDREKLLGCGNDIPSPFSGFESPFQNRTAFSFPAVGIKTEVSVAPGAKKEKILVFCPASNRQQALEKLALIRKNRLPDIRRAVKDVLGGSESVWGERFLKSVFFGYLDSGPMRVSAENRVSLSSLWQKGISGDIPIIRVQADGLTDNFITSFLRLYKTLGFCCVRTDIVFITEKPEDYSGGFSSRIKKLVSDEGLTDELYKNGGIKVLSADACSKEFLAALYASPGLTFPCEEEPVYERPEIKDAVSCEKLFEGENTFVPGGYFIGSRPKRPWCHTLSNPVFGTLLSFNSLGYTWALNSRQNKLTPWNNDPAVRFTGEELFLRADNKLYNCIDGSSVYFLDSSAVFGAKAGKIAVKTQVQVDKKAMKKRIRVSFSENSGQIKFIFRVKPCLCDTDKKARYIHPEAENGRLIFENPSNAEYGGFMCVYADGGETSFKDGIGEISVSSSDNQGEICFYMLFAARKEALTALSALPFNEDTPKRRILSSGNKKLDEFASSLLLHQVYDTRILARTGFYQCSGAFGFRDQLQDAMNICSVYPKRAMVQILRCASAQFSEGDVLHWFHQVTKPYVRFKGVRTHYSDDMLWLPLAAARYVKLTGSTDILFKQIAFIEAPPLSPGERERYGDYSGSGARFSLYEHCIRAIKKPLVFGAHSLPLIMGGDWNDSFNEVGIRGKGESVWLGMFIAVVCEEFSEISRLCGDRETEKMLKDTAFGMRQNIREYAYNGEYFVRGFYDDGSVLGGLGSDACKIDILPQAFAVFAGIGEKKERVKALKTAFYSLFSEKHGALRLFYPPFNEKTSRAGYVNDYPEGVRENAGQYTHAAVWFLSALKKEGLTEEYNKLLSAILPNNRPEEFLNEPYALTADINMSRFLEGRGGWSLYTGAAGWLWRELFES
ncbi:MAG: hypothetical protein J1E34_02035 [Oscillospiraceae bacterium]|nr:hypothetical protein [Oscillospiraceae bacterium]